MRTKNIKACAAVRNVAQILPFLFIIAMFMLQLGQPDKTFSREERRYLAQWPAYHTEKVLDGSYEAKVEAYFSDQFPFRSFWVHVQEGSDSVLVKSDLP